MAKMAIQYSYGEARSTGAELDHVTLRAVVLLNPTDRHETRAM